MGRTGGPGPAGHRGGLVISLDFELAWGVHDSAGSDGPYRKNLLGAREVVPRLLDLFAELDVHATWATVGFLFAGSREELEHFSPSLKPSYLDPRRDPYRIEIGPDERGDPLHFGQSLVRLIASAPGQELASHTFSHYYCLEEGQSFEEFGADLEAAQAIARSLGSTLTSLVLPRHQNRPDYLPAIAAAGFTTYRSNEANWLNRPATTHSRIPFRRAMRLLDSYCSVTGANAVPWVSTLPDSYGLVDVRESRFLRPVGPHVVGLEEMRYQRVANAMREAARSGTLFHLWWHPHNFGASPDENLRHLGRLLQLRKGLYEEHGFESFNMGQVDELVRSASFPLSVGGALGTEPVEAVTAAARAAATSGEVAG